ncbi:MAG: hypothetical protein ACLP8S_18100 [Solirubrobacteraceae bacterium]
MPLTEGATTDLPGVADPPAPVQALGGVRDGGAGPRGHPQFNTGIAFTTHGAIA